MRLGDLIQVSEEPVGSLRENLVDVLLLVNSCALEVLRKLKKITYCQCGLNVSFANVRRPSISFMVKEKDQMMRYIDLFNTTLI